MKSSHSKATLLLAATLSLGLWLPTSPTHAAVALHYPLDELADGADEIVHAQVVSQVSYRDEQAIFTETTLEIIDCLKGQHAAGDRVVVRQQGGRVDHLAMVIPGMPTFEPGEEVVLFLERPHGAASTMVVGLAQGKFRVVTDPETGARWIHRDLSGLARVDPQGRFLEPAQGGHPQAPDALHTLQMTLPELSLAEQIQSGPVVTTFDRFMMALDEVLSEGATR